MESHAMRLVFIFTAFFSVAYGKSPLPCEFPAIFNFGDSNSDTGGLAAAFGQHGAPNGESYFGGPAGRLCDGRLIIDFMAESLGFPYLRAYLESVGSNFTHGANFATAGSSIRPPLKTILQSGISPFNLPVQLKQFHDFKEKTQKLLNTAGTNRQGIENITINEPKCGKYKGISKGIFPKAEDFSSALYTIDIGHNDFYDLIYMPPDQVTTNISKMLDEVKTTLTDIYNLGGRSFWIHNVGPIGCLADSVNKLNVTDGKVDRAGCAIHENELVQNYNRRLKETVVQLRKDYPLAAFTYVDIYAVKYTLFSHAEENGFEDPLQVCCGYGGKYNYGKPFCGKNVTMENGRQVFAGKCKDPNVRINWDGIHLTQAANQWVFDKIVDGTFSDPPIPLKMACHRQW